MTPRGIEQLVEQTIDEVADPIVYAEALTLIDQHKRDGRKVVIVSASPEQIVRPLGRYIGVTDFIATKVKTDAAGFFLDELELYAMGEGKVDAINELTEREGIDLDSSYAYSDSVTDLPMMEMVGNPVAVNPDQRLFASHPVYQYLARRYDLRIEDMVWEPDEMPDDQQWQRLRLVHESFPADWMLWEKQPLPDIAQQLDAMGIGIAVFDPCANRPASGDFLSVMRENITVLGRTYASKATPRGQAASPVVPVKPAVEY